MDLWSFLSWKPEKFHNISFTEVYVLSRVTPPFKLTIIFPVQPSVDALWNVV